jgi:threonine aldolase
MPPTIDLRSDTVTRPTPAMRAAMAEAEVGDDVLGDDPTIIRLQERIAEIMGKPAACFVPSGSMANQTAIRAQTEHGDEVIAHEDSHIIHYETGAPAALSGCMIRGLRGPAGLFDADDVDAAIRPGNSHFPHSALLIIENTHNRGGGSVWTLDRVQRVTQRARQHGLKLHLDGARIWNACAATGHKPEEYARHFDTVSCCFSKGLGAPVGSAVCGTKETIARVHRFRKMFGGAMRQSGILAAAALHALENHRDRLVEDHTNARTLAQGLAEIPGLTIPFRVETNMVFFDIAADLGTAAEVCDKLKARGVWMLATAPQRVRAVCHLDVDRAGIERAIVAVRDACGAGATVTA